ncbi:hypothetical protein [Flavobacterium aestuarii]|uniref:hypothetical protein n=1 Tax=Flavobacterium aestuarii TaxID=3149227 RepID=UPI0032B46FDD
MIVHRNILILSIIVCSVHLHAKKKTIHTNSITSKISIDGKLNEEAWKSAEIAADFVMYQPDNGKPINDNKNTIVKILYDNDAVYICCGYA